MIVGGDEVCVCGGKRGSVNQPFKNKTKKTNFLVLKNTFLMTYRIIE